MDEMKNKYGKIGILLMLFLSWGCASSRAVQQTPSPPLPPQRERVYFKFDKSEIQPQDHEVLDKIAEHIRSSSKSVAVLEGNSDETGSDEYNNILAENRARAVRVYLRDQGADPRRLTILSKGESDPAVAGRTRQARSANRRVEVILMME